MGYPIDLDEMQSWRIVNEMVGRCYGAAKDAGWWGADGSIHDPNVNPYRVPAAMALIHSEISEALEGDRKDTADAHLPNRRAVEVELADALIRICDLAGKLEFDLGSAVQEKMEYNKTRLDHKLKNRSKARGKKY